MSLHTNASPLQQAFIEKIGAAVSGDMRFEALFLGGSFGRGSADAYSDLDFIGLVDADSGDLTAAAWQGIVEAISPVVFWNRLDRGGPLLNAITQDWLRIDVHILTPAAFLDRVPSSGASRATLVPLVDRQGIFDTLPAYPGKTAPNGQQVDHLIREFIRVLGLIVVGLGRDERVLGVTGAGLLRDLLTKLMIEETQSPERGGALHLSRIITADQMAELESLPYPGPTRADVLKAHSALAKNFFPRATRLAAELDLPWPDAFENATRRHLERAFGIELWQW
ncbi:hypothetical protein [Mesorhizobium sp. CAU 1741]|uniref:hypothetical protein n=1 Tax=Mesorhizobium sp. CAU 1741 TaxID=3140366 RepID=UPI00325AB273